MFKMKANFCNDQLTCKIICLVLLHLYQQCTADDYTVLITGDSNVVIGGTLHLKAELFDDSSVPAVGDFQFQWRDNAIPSHGTLEQTTRPVSFWNITYSTELYAPGPYNVEVEVAKKSWWSGYRLVTSQRFAVNITLFVSGEVDVSQGGISKDVAVAVNQPAVHSVSLSHADDLYIRKNKNRVITYWFVDCSYVGPTEGLSSAWKYSQVDSTHIVDTILVASYIPPPPPTTTTTTTTSTTTTSTTTTSTTTTTPPSTTTTPTTTTTAKVSPVNMTAANVTAAPAPVDPWNEFLVSFPKYNTSQRNMTAPAQCFNITSIPMSDNSTYGFFQKKIIAKAPVKLTVNGTNWLRHGDIFNMNITCNGSSPLSYCINLIKGQYNVTGNETCENKPLPLPSTTMQFSHLFREPAQYTFLVIVQNPVSRTVTPVGVNIYEVKKQPQISVIVVPVAFSIVAVILIVAGVAWYVHTRRTFPVEVANFDFGQQSSDMEYKTFRERLRDSVMASFFRAGDPNEGSSNAGWSPTRKYGSMQ